jgi:hypothetical protein
MRHHLLPTTIAALSLLAACAQPLENQTPTTTPAAVQNPGDPGCPEWKCTGNSPDMSGFEFHELHELQLPNSAGFILRRLRKEGVDYHPDVRGDRLYGLGPGGVIVLQDDALEGAELVLEHTTIPGEFAIHITEVNDNVAFWAAPKTPIQTYELDYTAPGAANRTPLCANPPASVGADGVRMAPSEAILFAGDRYNDQKRLVAHTEVEAGDWFNIGCAGSALAKLHLNRFTTAGKHPSQPATSRDERQDVLAMYTGNVCGTGTAYTKAGTEIRWGSKNEYRSLAGFTKHEAIWKDGRAVCVSAWRLDATHPWLQGAMDSECGTPTVPVCTAAQLADWQSYGTVISGVP